MKRIFVRPLARRVSVILVALAAALLASCDDQEVTAPELVSPPEPSLALSAAFSSYVFSPITKDDGGPNDNPAQSDLNAFARADNVSGHLAVLWHWDDINSWTGSGQTGDACALFDTAPNNGFANFALCVRITNNASGTQVFQLDPGSPILYSCGDKRTDRCSQPVNGPLNLSGITCEVTTETDAFPNQGDDGLDTLAGCIIPLAAIGGAGQAQDVNLLNVCSFPSGEPNSNNFDCVVTPGSGYLQIVKKTSPTASGNTFTFALSPAASDGRTSFSLKDSIAADEATALIPVAPGTFSLTEGTLPAGWQLFAASCLRGTAPTGTKSGNTVSGIGVSIGETTVCTFDNRLGAPTISVVKTAGTATLPETGGNVTYTVQVTNTSAVSVTLSSLSDDIFGTSLSPCATGGSIAAGATYQCQFTKALGASTSGASHINTITATVTNGGGSANASDTAKVVYADVAPTVTVLKTANPTTVPETGGNVTFTVRVSNTSAEAVTLTALSDNRFANISPCAVNGSIAAGAYYECQFTKSLSGEVATPHVDTVTATVRDDDNTTATAADSAKVIFSDVAPTITVLKTASPTSVPETGANVTFTVRVTNTSQESVTLTALTDSKFPNISPCVTGGSIAAGAYYECEFTKMVSGEVATPHVDTVTATVKDNENTTASAEDDATVTFTNVLPTLTVEKTANPTSVPETGADVTFTVKVTNTSQESVTLTALSDNRFANITPCGTGGTIAAGAFYQCQFVKNLTGEVATPHIDTVTATVRDNENTTATATDSARVTFTDVAPTLTVVKTANPTSLPETGGDVTFTVRVNNTSPEAVTLTALTDTDFPNISPCVTGGSIAAGGYYQCQFVKSLTGNVSTPHVDTVSATIRDNDNTTASASDSAKVTFSNIAPTLTVLKTASPTSVPETGGNVTFTVRVTNTSDEAVTLTALSDNRFANISPCTTGAELDPDEHYECSFTKPLSGNAGTTHVDTVSATVEDDDGTSATGKDDATVTFTNVNPDISVSKTANPTSLSSSSGGLPSTFTPDRTFTENSDPPAPGGFEFLEATCDDAGANDVPAQVDLNCFNRADNVDDTLVVQWSWDDINSWTGSGQTGDACALLDSDNDGNSNVAVCARISNTSDGLQVLQVPSAGWADVYSCNDTRPDRCANNWTQLTQSAIQGTICTIETSDEGFPGLGDDGSDVMATCIIDLDMPGLISATEIELLNVCSFPSGSPNSNPFDCVVQAGAGFLRIVKNVTPASTALFGFTLSPAATDGDNDFAVQGGVTTGLIAVAPGTNYSLTEILPSGWSLTSASCTVDGANTGTFSSTNKRVSGFAIRKGQTTTCTFNNDGGITGNVTYTIVVTNNGLESVKLDQLTDDKFGNLAGQGDCSVTNINIAGGATYTCSFTKTLSGNPGTSHTNEVTAVAKDDEGNSDTAKDTETVTFLGGS